MNNMAQQKTRRSVSFYFRDLYLPPHGQPQGIRSHNGGRACHAATNLACKARNYQTGSPTYPHGHAVGCCERLEAGQPSGSDFASIAQTETTRETPQIGNVQLKRSYPVLIWFVGVVVGVNLLV
jgi:hypothetical protein